MESQLWLNGPQFLLKAKNDWPRTKIETLVLSPQPQCFVSISVSKDPTLMLNLVNWSSWTRLTRVSVWVFRFIANCRASRDHRLGPLTPDEIHDVEVRIFRDAQRTDFSEEFSAIPKGTSLT